MTWRELKGASSDQRDFYWWEREQEAITMRDTYARLGHKEAAESWQKRLDECRRNRKPK